MLLAAVNLLSFSLEGFSGSFLHGEEAKAYLFLTYARSHLAILTVNSL